MNIQKSQSGSTAMSVPNFNQKHNCSFSDYVNKLRIEYAKQLITDNPEIKLIIVAEKSGFSNEQSFYRNFVKFTGVQPKKWLNELKDSSI